MRSRASELAASMRLQVWMTATGIVGSTIVCPVSGIVFTPTYAFTPLSGGFRVSANSLTNPASAPYPVPASGDYVLAFITMENDASDTTGKNGFSFGDSSAVNACIGGLRTGAGTGTLPISPYTVMTGTDYATFGSAFSTVTGAVGVAMLVDPYAGTCQRYSATGQVQTASIAGNFNRNATVWDTLPQNCYPRTQGANTRIYTTGFYYSKIRPAAAEIVAALNHMLANHTSYAGFGATIYG